MKKIIITLGFFYIAVISCKKDTPAPPPTAPLVTTAALTNITSSGATGGGSIVSDGGATVTKSGIVWSKTNNTPTLADTIVAGTTATGVFTSNITGLDFNNSYYVRAFATNSVGTGYGAVVTLSTANDTSKVRFMYNGKEVTYGIIISSASGKKWLDRNLGATQAATAYDDYKGYGDLFQWGRPADGHQLINWTASDAGTPVNGTVNGITATSDIPGNSNFINPPYDYPLDWRSDNNRNRWVTTPQGPCPTGWHVPKIAEWLGEVSKTSGGTASSGGMTDRNNGYTQLKLTIGGERVVDGPTTVVFGQVGRTGFYWSSSDNNNTVDNYTDAQDIQIGGTFVTQFTDFKAAAKCVRCLKD